MIIDNGNLNVFKDGDFNLSKRVTYKILTEVPKEYIWNKLSSTRKRRIIRGGEKLQLRKGERVTEFIKLQEI